MGAIQTSPLNLVPTQPDYRPYKLRCRFMVWAAPCHRVVTPLAALCEHLDRAGYEAGSRFLEDMEHQGWRPVDGRLHLTGGPFPATLIVTGVPNRPNRQKAVRGPHPRTNAEATYVSPDLTPTTLDTTDSWEFELTGWFVRRMMPTIMTVEAAKRVEQNRAARRARLRSHRGR